MRLHREAPDRRAGRRKEVLMKLWLILLTLLLLLLGIGRYREVLRDQREREATACQQLQQWHAQCLQRLRNEPDDFERGFLFALVGLAAQQLVACQQRRLLAESDAGN